MALTIQALISIVMELSFFVPTLSLPFFPQNPIPFLSPLPCLFFSFSLILSSLPDYNSYTLMLHKSNLYVHLDALHVISLQELFKDVNHRNILSFYFLQPLHHAILILSLLDINYDNNIYYQVNYPQ